MIAKLIPIVDQCAASRMPLIPAHVLNPGGTLAAGYCATCAFR